VFLYSFLVGFSRLYVRVHSWNQIIYGWQLGAWAALYFHCCIREPLIQHINSVSTRTKLKPEDRNRYILRAICVFLLVCVSLATVFVLKTIFDPPLEEWREMIYQKCPKKADGKSRMFYDESIVMSGVCCIGFGAYIGIVLHRQYLGRTWPGMMETSVCQYFLRLIP
jgi:hypothetical protein